MPQKTKKSGDQLDRLLESMRAREKADPAHSYTASLLSGGVEKCARKMGEEALETIIAATGQKSGKQDIVSESADMLYHWLALMMVCDVDPADVYTELERRMGVSGHDEKASRS